MAQKQLIRTQNNSQPLVKKWYLLIGLIIFIFIFRFFSIQQSTKTNLFFKDWMQVYHQGSDKPAMVNKVDCQSIDNIRQQGLCFMTQNDLANLEESTQALLKNNPTQQMMALHLGNIYREANLENSAIAIWEQSGAWIQLASWGIEINKSGNEEKAAHIIEFVVDDIQSKPITNEAEVRYLKNALSILSKFRMDQGNYASAIEAYKARLILYPTSAFNHRQIGTAYRYLGEYEQAYEWLKQAEALAPDDIKIVQELGRVAALEGNWLTAIHYFEKVVEVKPTSQIQYELGIAYENIGDLILAQHAFEKALDLSGGSRIRNRLALARVCEQADCIQTSIKQYYLILQQEPDNKEAQEQLLIIMKQ